MIGKLLGDRWSRPKSGVKGTRTRLEFEEFEARVVPAIYHVDTEAELVQAVDAANLAPTGGTGGPGDPVGAHLIYVEGVIQLTSPLPVIVAPVELIGAGAPIYAPGDGYADLQSVYGAIIAPSYANGGGRVLNAVSDLTVRGLGISGGYLSASPLQFGADGGNILYQGVNGALTIEDSIIEGGTTWTGNGGNIYSLRQVNIVHSNIIGGTAVNGAGIYQTSASLQAVSITDESYLGHNYASNNGGAVWVDTLGTLYVRDSLFNEMWAGNAGGAIYVLVAGSVDIQGGTDGNGAYGPDRTVAIDNSCWAEMDGGGLYVVQTDYLILLGEAQIGGYSPYGYDVFHASVATLSHVAINYDIIDGEFLLVTPEATIEG